MKHAPQEMLNGITTRSPGLMCSTAGPTSSTMPIGSWPRTSPSSRNGPRTPYRCRSEPQIAVDVMRTIASVGCSMRGSGTVSTRTSSTPCHVNARMGHGVPRREAPKRGSVHEFASHGVDGDAPEDEPEENERAQADDVGPALEAERRVAHELDAVVQRVELAEHL